MEEKVRMKRPHRLNMEDRKRIDFTGITDVVSFDPVKVLLESDYGHITIKGEGLHVNRLSVEKGELDLDGRVDSICYSEAYHRQLLPWPNRQRGRRADDD